MYDLVMAEVTTAGPSAAADSVAQARPSDYAASGSTVLSVRSYSPDASDLVYDWTSIFDRLDLLAVRTRLTGYEQMEYYSLRNQLSVLMQSHINSEKINDQLRGQVADLKITQTCTKSEFL